MNNYFKKNLKQILTITSIILFYNFYFILCIDSTKLQYLCYGDFLVATFLCFYFGFDYYHEVKKQKMIDEYLKSSFLIVKEDMDFENKALLMHDIDLIQDQLHKQIQINQDQIDFITKWCHEIKLPLTTLGLLNEHIENLDLKAQIKEQIENMKLYLNAVIVACKVQSPFDDLHLTKINLKKCIQTSIKNHRYF